MNHFRSMLLMQMDCEITDLTCIVFFVHYTSYDDHYVPQFFGKYKVHPVILINVEIRRDCLDFITVKIYRLEIPCF